MNNFMKGDAMQDKLTKVPGQEYQDWFNAQVRLGLEDIEAGRVVAHEQVCKDMQTLLETIKKEHAPKAP
ncbi:MAG: hypothetical protein Q8O79_01580 [Pseudomonadota bacterium]|nr:hypothetical protein [Pseudomonadota bacterium]